MKKLIIALVLILSIGTVSAGTYSIVTANYPILVNGEKVQVQPYNLNGTTLLPIRAVSDALGVPINWTGKAVEINTVDVEELKEACVMIYTDDGKTQVQGSGVYTDYDEVTSALHLTDANRTNIKTSDGDKLTIGGTNTTLDVMTLDSTEKTKPVKIGDSDEVKVGDKVIVVGSPQGKNDTVVYGTVSNPDPRGMVVLSDGLSSPTKGISGGGVFDLNGCLIGILVAQDNNKSGRFLVIPINDVREAL